MSVNIGSWRRGSIYTRALTTEQKQVSVDTQGTAFPCHCMYIKGQYIFKEPSNTLYPKGILLSCILILYVQQALSQVVVLEDIQIPDKEPIAKPLITWRHYTSPRTRCRFSVLSLDFPASCFSIFLSFPFNSIRIFFLCEVKILWIISELASGPLAPCDG